MEIRIPHIITPTTRMTQEQAELAHQSVPSAINGCPVALFCPHPDGAARTALDSLYQKYPAVCRLPVLSVPVTDEMFDAHLTGDARSIESGIVTVNDCFDTLVINLRAGASAVTLLFDLADPVTNRVLEQCMEVGKVPCVLRAGSRIGTRLLPLEPEYAAWIADNKRHTKPTTAAMFETLWEATHADCLKAERLADTTMLVASRETLPAALGLQRKRLYLDDDCIGTAEMTLLLPNKQM